MYRTFLAALVIASELTVAHAATFTVINTADSGAGSLRQANTDANGCPGYRGTAELSKFGDLNSHQITYSPSPVPTKKWLETGESYTVYYLDLSASKRQTNGYNTGYDDHYITSTSFAVERIS